MMKRIILFYTVFVFVVECSSEPRKNDEDLGLDIDFLLKIMKQMAEPCASEPCQNNGVCIPTPDHFKCICNQPYFGDTCSEDPCTPNPCKNEGKCKHEGEGFECVCKSSFRGETCELDPCSPNPCENNGRCNLIDNSFNCTCKNPYHGNVCELGPCYPNPCKNKGECEEDGDKFNCICKNPFRGETCEQSPCAPNPCQNDGKCYLTAENDFVCACKEPFSGERCEKGPCKPNPCQNDGECIIRGNSTICRCNSAYFGEYCDKDLCSKMSCKNDGKCTIEGNKFKCECKSPFTGEKCEKDLCTSNPCKNNGICKLDGYGFKCECRSPYKGKQCEKGPCSSNPCLNKGECKEDGNTFHCECVPPYEGKHCEKGHSTEPDTSITTFSDSVKTMNVTLQNITEVTDSYNWKSSGTSAFTSDDNATTFADRNSTNGIMSTTLKKGICETDGDCFNGGTCRRVKEGKHICVCAENFGGVNCEVNLPCVGIDQSCRIINAVCVIVDNHAICECPNGTLYHRKSGLCEDICDPRKCLHGKCEIIGKTYKCNCDEGYTGNHCDERERGNHENFVPWFTVIATINLFVCVLLILMFCVVCQIKRFINSS